MTTYRLPALSLTRTLAPSSAHRDVSVVLLSGKATDKKLEALDMADEAAVVAISHGSGAVAKKARELKTGNEFASVVRHVGNGNLHAFAVIVAAKLGESVKFQKRVVDDEIISTATDSFKSFAGVLQHKMLQLEAKGKVYNSKGGYTSAAADLQYLMSLHSSAVAVIDARDAADAERRERIAMENKGAEESSGAFPQLDTDMNTVEA